MRSFFEKFGKFKQDLKSHEWDLRVSDQERQERLDVCSNCDKFNKTINFCSECGCHIPSKSLFWFSECPLDKWKVQDVKQSD